MHIYIYVMCLCMCLSLIKLEVTISIVCSLRSWVKKIVCLLDKCWGCTCNLYHFSFGCAWFYFVTKLNWYCTECIMSREIFEWMIPWRSWFLFLDWNIISNENFQTCSIEGQCAVLLLIFIWMLLLALTLDLYWKETFYWSVWQRPFIIEERWL